jgi:uncharacterized protein YecE (DUF72 family)
MLLNRKRAERKPQIRIGCSGWQYRHWRGDFYPADLPTSRWFAHYARTFDTVEINNSFYRLPPPETFEGWRAQAPRGFLYAVKASRFLTHMKKLTDPEAPLTLLFYGVRNLRDRLGPVLYQLPPNWPLNLDRIERFLDVLPRALDPGDDGASARRRDRGGARPVIEFREPSWYDDRVFDLLRRHGVALCLHDMPGSATGRMLVGPFVYVRFHGAAKYAGRYADERLENWAAWLTARAAEGIDVFAYFNNDAGGHAPRDAVRLRESIGRRRQTDGRQRQTEG